MTCRNMKFLFIFILLLSFLINGCAVVTSDSIIGTPAPLSAGEWDGTWRNEDVAVQVKVMDDRQGILKVAWFESENRDLLPETMRLQITKGENWRYANVLEGSIYKDLAKYGWGRIQKEGERILFWYPNAERFGQDVRSGALDGQVHEEKKEHQPGFWVQLKDSGSRIVDQVESGGAEYFLWDKPLTFIKID